MTDRTKLIGPWGGASLSGGISRRRFLGSASAVAAVAAVAAAPSLLPRPAAAAPKKGGTLRVGRASGATTDTLDPGVYEGFFMISLAFAVHGHLTEVGADGSLQPELAESWEASADAARWTFKLRKGVEFHSGKTLDADDVIASINHHRGEETKSAAAPIVKAITDIRADGPDTVVVTLEAGNADFPFILSDYHLTIHPAKDGKLDWASGDGCGAYKIDTLEPGVQVVMSKHANFWRDDRGHFDSIHMLALIDPTARTSAMIQGKVDTIDQVDLKTVDLLRKVPTLDVHSVAGTQHYTFAMSCNKPPYTDVNVRLALKYGIDRQQLVDKILRGYGAIGNDHPIGRGQRYFNKDLAQIPYDPEKAKWYLKQAGLDSLDIELSAADAAYSGAVDAAILYKEAAEPAGININVTREPNDGYWSNVWMKKPFSAVNWGGRPVEGQMFSTAYQSGAAWNDTFWSNARFDELLLAARAELDDAKRREMYYEMQAILNQDGGAIIPMFASYVFATSKKIAYPDQFASNWGLDGERWAERWWFA